MTLFSHQELTKRALTKRQLESYRASGTACVPRRDHPHRGGQLGLSSF